jgi:hypothetical protein
MIVLHAAAVNASDIGGPHASVPALVAAQNRLDGVQAALLATGSATDGLPKGDFPVFGLGVGWHKFAETLVGRRRRINSLRGGFFRTRVSAAADGPPGTLPAPFDHPDLVVFHSTYIPAHLRIGGRLRKAGIPYVICPRGGMTRYAQTHKWLKKGRETCWDSTGWWPAPPACTA